jgi:O-antigen/teichoic acid export membrane protein
MLVLIPPYSYDGAALAFLGFAIIKSAMSYGIFEYYVRKDQG